MTLTNDELKILLRQEQIDEEYKKSVERMNRCSPHIEPVSESIFDNTARPLSTNLYLDCKEYERGDRWHKLEREYVLGPDYVFISSFGYHLLTKALPLWLFIMLYW